MLALSYRPNKFSEIVGQKIPNSILRAAVRSPQNAVRCMILEGSYGTGKTTSARVFAKALNCLHKKDDDPCGVCDICKATNTFSPYYQELDSAMVGNVETIRDMRADLFYAPDSYWKVVVFDEYHLCSRSSQSALLTALEGIKKNIFILFCTTDVERVLNTIRSRSIVLKYESVTLDLIVKNLNRIINKEGIQIEPSIVEGIAIASRGHVRDSVMKLDLYRSIGKEDFLDLIKSAECDFLNLLVSIKKADQKSFEHCLQQLASQSLDNLKFDFFNVLTNVIKAFCETDFYSPFKDKVKETAKLLGYDIFQIYQWAMQPWVLSSFEEDHKLHALLWTLYSTKNKKQGVVDVSSRMVKT